MNNRKPRWSPATVTGVISLIAAAFLFFIHPWFSAAALLLYVVLCIWACFFPGTNFIGPVISRGKSGQPMVALTFDDGPSATITPRILDLLGKYQFQATFFVSGVNAENHPDIIADIVARGHDIGNHSFSHLPFLMLKGHRTLYREISDAQRILRSMGIETKAFRPPVGIINPKLFEILMSLGMFCVIFSCRAFDAGNRRIENLSTRILNRVTDDDIILLHDVPARGDEDGKKLLMEMEKIFTGIGKKGLHVVPLGRLIGQEIMTKPRMEPKGIKG